MLVKVLNMKPRFLLATILLASLLITGLATAAIPALFGGQITDSVTHAVDDMIDVPDMSALGAWNNQIWGSGDDMHGAEWSDGMQAWPSGT
jgi:hypothetical protein